MKGRSCKGKVSGLMNKSFWYTTLLMSASSLFAQPSVDQRIEILEREMKEVRVETATGTAGALFSSGKRESIRRDWTIEIEALLWRAKPAGTDWALVLNQGIFPNQGYMKNLSFGWDWGFRVMVGKSYSHDDWDINLAYTRFHSNQSSKVNQSFNTPAGTDGEPGAQGPYGTAFASYDYHLAFDAVDLDLGKTTFNSGRLSFHPHAGIKNIWMNQKGTLTSENYVNALNTLTPVEGNINVKLYDQSKYWGIGPKAGTDLTWYFTKGFKLRTAIEGALLFGFFKVPEEENIVVAPNGVSPTDTTLDLTANMHRYVPYTRMLIGLAYGDYFNKSKSYFLEGSIDYEVNYFWRANQMINQLSSSPVNLTLAPTQSVRLTYDRVTGDVAFYGVTFRLSLMF